MNREENLQTIYILHTNKNIKKKIITYSIVIEKKLENETHNIITQKYSPPPPFKILFLPLNSSEPDIGIYESTEFLIKRQ